MRTKQKQFVLLAIIKANSRENIIFKTLADAETTITHKIFETSCSFLLKQRITGKG